MYAGHFDWTVPLMWTVPGALAAEDARAIIATTAPGPWLPASINGADGRYVNERVRSNTLAMMRDPSLCARLFDRLRPELPAQIAGKQLKSLHPSSRVYRYELGQHFGLHRDQPYEDPDGDWSRLTLIVYLDEGCQGGETHFPEFDRVIVPATGTALLFQHMLLHEGTPVRAGIKHLLRTDVMYR